MSVPVRLRKVKDNLVNSKFAVEEAIINLVKHTFTCCDTVDRKYPESKAISDKIRKSALRIFELENNANSVPFANGSITEENFQERTELIENAMRECNTFVGYLTLGKAIYHWRATKLDYWQGLVEHVYSLLNKWFNWCEKEYRG